MTRIAFVPAGIRAPASVLGHDATGAWLECDDAALVRGRLELLWLSRAGYDHAVRRLHASDIPAVIARRRTAFAAQLPSRAKTELYALRLPILVTAARHGDRDAVARSLTILARLSGGSRFKGVDDTGMLERLLEREQTVRAELDSDDGRPEAAPGEPEMRAQLADGTARLLAGRGRPEYVQAPLYASLARGYLLRAAPDDLLADWKRNGIPAVPWRGGVIGPLAPAQAAELHGRPMFPDGNTAAGLRAALTPAQLTVELEDREQDLGMTAHVASLRVELAVFRRLAALRPALTAVLTNAIAEETRWLITALARRPATTAPADFAAATELLAALVALHGPAWLAFAAELRTLERI